jgi:hypothetical protein
VIGWILMTLTGATVATVGVLIVVHRKRVSRWQQRYRSERDKRNSGPVQMGIVGAGALLVGGVWFVVGLSKIIPMLSG